MYYQKLGLLTVVLAATLFTACDDGDEASEPESADFYVTVKLERGFLPTAVDRLEILVYDSLMILEELHGDQFDGGITWNTRDGANGDEFVVEMTGDYFQANAIEVAEDSWELDVPFIGGLEEAAFNIYVTVYFEDNNGTFHEIGYGTSRLPLPVDQLGTSFAVDVNCDRDWGYTCTTGCDDGAERCEDSTDVCGEGAWECVDGCCVPAD